MDKEGKVIFSNFQKGQVKHPIYGFGILKNVEVFENKGIAKIKNRTTPETNISPTQLPIAEVYDEYGNTYTMTGETGAGAVYKNGVALASGLSNCWDLKIYKNYLWARYSTVMSCYGPLSSGGAQWFANVDSGFVNSYRGALLVGQDNFLYSGNGNNVAKIEVTASGTPGTMPTLSSNKTALDLKDGEYVSCMEEYGTKIVIGVHGGVSYYDRVNHPIAKLYPWNRQLGTLGNPGLADLPVSFTENGINAIKEHANKLYISAGVQGNIYVTDSTNYTQICTIPYTESGITSQSSVFPNAFNVSAKGNLLVGLSADNNSLSRPGIYEIDINTTGYPISYWTTSTTTGNTGKIGFVNSTSYQTTKVGYAFGSTFGVDSTDFRMYPSYGAVIETQLVKVGRSNSKKTFQHIEWSLAEPLVSGQNIRISYRLDNKSAYTPIGTWGYSTQGSVLSFEDTAAIVDAQYVQLKIELDQSLSTIYGSNINLVDVMLW